MRNVRVKSVNKPTMCEVYLRLNKIHASIVPILGLVPVLALD